MPETIRTKLPLALAAALSAMVLPLASSALAGPPPGLDVTGTWRGSITCIGVDYDGKKFRDSQSGDIQIATEGALVAVNTEALVLNRRTPFLPAPVTRCGESILLEGKTDRGLVSLSPLTVSGEVIGGAEDLDFEAVYLRTARVFAAKANGLSGLMKGSSTILPFFGAAGTCKWKFVRVSTQEPDFLASICVDGEFTPPFPFP